MLKIVAISDTHGYHRQIKLPEGDVLVHSGDFCRRGDFSEYTDFVRWLSEQPHAHKVFTCGNHDKCCEDLLDICKTVTKKNVHFLVNDSVTIGGKVFYGSPITPQFGGWSFMRDRGARIAAEWSLIPKSTDVLITHGPAYGHGDLAPRRVENARVAGCLELLKRIQVVRPQLHVFGHIHDGYGVSQSDEIRETTFVNASTCNEQYQPVNPPIIITIK